MRNLKVYITYRETGKYAQVYDKDSIKDIRVFPKTTTNGQIIKEMLNF